MSYLNQEQIDKLIKNHCKCVIDKRAGCQKEIYGGRMEMSERQKRICIIENSEDFIDLFKTIENSINVKIENKSFNSLTDEELVLLKKDVFDMIHDLLSMNWSDDERHVLRVFLSKSNVIKGMLRSMIKKGFSSKEEYISLLKNVEIVKIGSD